MIKSDYSKRIGFVFSNVKLIIVTLLIAIFSIFYAQISIQDHKIMAFILAIYYLFGEVCLLIVVKHFKDIHKVFLAFALIMGFAYVMVLPPNAVPDEMTHYLRIFDISRGNLVFAVNESGKVGSYFPANIHLSLKNYQSLLSAIRLDLDYNNMSFIDMPTSALYFPVCYFPQVMGVFVARLFTKNAIFIIYTSRLFNFLFSTLIIYYSIKIIPYGKMMIFAISALPMFCQQQVSVSADVMTNALSIFVISYVLYLSYKQKIIKTHQLLILMLSVCVLSLCKIVYFLFVFVVFVIPHENFKSRKVSIIFKCIVVLLSLVLNAFWFIFSSRYFVEFREGVNITQQIIYVLNNPISYVNVLFKTMFDNSLFYVDSLVGASLGWLDVGVNYVGYEIALILLVIVALFYSKNDYMLHIKLFLFSLVLCTIFLIFSALYAQWTPVASDTVAGVQGRYFIPLLLPMALCLPKFGLNIATEKDILIESDCSYIFISFFFANTFAITALANRFIGG